MKKVVFKSILIVALIIALSAIFISCFNNKGDDEPTIPELTADMITIYSEEQYYTGEPITLSSAQFRIEVNGRIVNGVLFELTYKDNVEVGTATVTFTAKEDNKFCSGSASKTFIIKATYNAVYANNYDELVSLVHDPNYARIEVNFDLEIPENETLTIDEGKRVNMSLVKDDNSSHGGEFVNNGKIVIGKDSTISVGGSSNATTSFYNNGSIEGEGQIQQAANSGFYNAGSIATNNKVKIYGAFYTNSDVEYELQGNGKYTKRQQITASIVTTSLVDNKIQFNKETYKNQPKIYLEGQYYSFVNFENYEHAGEARYSINPLKNDNKYYGSYSSSYTITKGETTFSDYYQFLEYQESGDYYKYTLLEGGDFFAIDLVEIAKDEEVYLNNAEFIRGVINEGKLSANSLTIREKTFQNYGVVEGDVYSSVNITNGSSNNTEATMNGSIYKRNATDSITVKNYGTISNEKSLCFDDIVENYGLIEGAKTSGNVRFKHDLLNEGIVKAENGCIFESSIFNSTGAQLIIGGNSKIDISGIVDNYGKITNNGNFALDNNVQILVNDAFENNGHVWGFADSFIGISDNYTKKVALTNEMLELSIGNIDYDKTAHKADVTVNGETLDLTKSSISFLRSEKTTTDFTSVGQIDCVVRILNDYYKYSGSCSKSYRINYGSTTVDSISTLASALNDKNWGSISLSADIIGTQFTTSSLTISSTQSLDTNGHRLELHGNNLSVYGKLYVDSIGSGDTIENVGLYYDKSTYSSASLHIHEGGEIVNNGLVYFSERIDANSIGHTGTGKITNNGTLYTIVNINYFADNNGDLYIRKQIENSNVELQYTDINYDYGNALTPTLELKTGTTTIDPENYSVEYTNNINAGQASITITNQNDFSPYFYGSYVAHFTINRIDKPISGEYGTIDNSYFEDNINYYKFTLTQNVSLVEDITIPSNTILDLGPYRINTMPYLTQYTITLADDVEVYVEVSTFDDLEAYKYIATRIDITADITSTNTNKAFDIAMNKTASLIPGWSNYNQYKLEIDLNGHTLDANVTVKNVNVDYNATNQTGEINISFVSSGAKGTIGASGVSNIAFQQIAPSSPPSGRFNITLDNLTIYGMHCVGNINGTSSEEIRTKIIVTDCDFIAPTNKPAVKMGRDNKSQGYPFRLVCTFDNCSFTSQNSSGVYITSGDISFNNCTITSNGTYSTTGDYSGNGIGIYQHAWGEGYNIVVNVSNTTITALNGYGAYFAKGVTQSSLLQYTEENVTYSTGMGDRNFAI